MKSGNPGAPPAYYDDPGLSNPGYGQPPPMAPYSQPPGPQPYGQPPPMAPYSQPSGPQPPMGAPYEVPAAPYAQPQTNVVVVQPTVQQQRGATVVTTHNPTNHCLHCCISIFFPPWIICWIYFCCTEDTKTTVVAHQ